jgi:hypothetical protein
MAPAITPPFLFYVSHSSLLFLHSPFSLLSIAIAEMIIRAIFAAVVVALIRIKGEKT